MGLFSFIGKIAGVIANVASKVAPFVAMVNPAWGAALAGIAKVAGTIANTAGQDGSVRAQQQAVRYDDAANRAAEDQASRQASASLFNTQAATATAETLKANNAAATGRLFPA